MCGWEGERERERKKARERERERERQPLTSGSTGVSFASEHSSCSSKLLMVSFPSLSESISSTSTLLPEFSITWATQDLLSARMSNASNALSSSM